MSGHATALAHLASHKSKLAWIITVNSRLQSIKQVRLPRMDGRVADHHVCAALVRHMSSSSAQGISGFNKNPTEPPPG